MGESVRDMIIRKMRERGIRQGDLCCGLCSHAMMSKYLKGEGHIDRLLMTVLMQRLGMSPDNFTTLLTEEEYAYFEWRQETALAQLNREWGQLELLLKKPEARDSSCNEKLQRQYYLLLCGIVRKMCHGDEKGGLKEMEEAVSLTLPDFPAVNLEEVLLGGQEINGLLLWSGFQPDREKAYCLLKQLVGSIDKNYSNIKERCKFYPRTVAQLLPMMNQRGEYYECIVLAKRRFN